jgi:prepilin-type N-terminal cleavage/methylation domain-containing protein
MNRWVLRRNGFTVVELLIVIVVIGILATITIVAYNGIQQRAAATVVENDLTNIRKSMEITRGKKGAYPSAIPSDIEISPKISLAKISDDTLHYSGVTPVQNGVLFSEICDSLIAEGLGSGTNMGGDTDDYITSCDNYNHGSIQITGWDSEVFSTPLAESTITSYIASVPAGDAWHPNQQSTVQNFYTELRDRFIATGGSFPIASFWDSWASPGNGVMHEDLPEPDETESADTSYCIQAVYDGKSDLTWHINEHGPVTPGAC